jgi:hypothetical protein
MVDKAMRKKENWEFIAGLIQKSLSYDNDPIKIGNQLRDKAGGS